MNEYWIWDKENEEWTGEVVYDFSYADKLVMSMGGYEKYDIFEKLS